MLKTRREGGARTRWWWVRHGPVIEQGPRVHGQLDVACDLSDEARLRALATALPEAAVWLTSPLRRTRDTARAIVDAGLAAPEPVVVAALAEQNFGAWQGRRWDDLGPDKGPEYRAFWADPGHSAPPLGESFADLVGRVSPAVEGLSAEHAGRDVVAVAHAGTIRAALALALGLEPARALAFHLDTLSLTRLDYVADEHLGCGAWRIMGVNLNA